MREDPVLEHLPKCSENQSFLMTSGERHYDQGQPMTPPGPDPGATSESKGAARPLIWGVISTHSDRENEQGT